jgi:hypothetical protein
MNRFKYVASALLALALVSGMASAALMSDVADAGTVVKNESVWPQYGADRRGLYVFQYTVPAAGITGAVDLVSWSIPKGTVILEDSFIEVETALLPAAGSAALAVGGVTFLADGSLLEATGIDPATDANVPNITTAADVPYITVTGTDATQGVFTVYLSVIGGNAR